MWDLFDGCIKLTSINLENFDTYNVKNMGKIPFRNSLFGIPVSEFPVS